jgi:secreted Zn-dependent insulinase-like peptidase
VDLGYVVLDRSPVMAPPELSRSSGCGVVDVASSSSSSSTPAAETAKGRREGEEAHCGGGDGGSCDVQIGPDLNASRPPLDKKLYRHITLPNGLQAVVIQDTIAMQQQKLAGGLNNNRGDYDTDESEDDDDDGEIEEDDDDDSGVGGGGGLRDAACCILVGAGSASDPPHCPGCAHFLEHLLFMGSVRYPGENEYEAYVSRHGGHDNAYTEWEYTCYSLEIPAPALWGAMDRLAQFFIAPLMLPSAVDRELQSIESEFMLTKNSDSSRSSQLICSCSDPQHPVAKFSWGNLKSLKEIPEKLGVDPMQELWKFYNHHYYAANMRLAVQGAYTLDELEKGVVDYFSGVPALPRDQSPPDQQLESMQQAGFPLPERTLGTVTRIVPVKDRHTLCITWQIPSQLGYWKSKPTNFLSHLLGHEASGSLLSYARKMSWATGCIAGCGDEGSENATSHAMFSISFTLSKAGLEHWRDLVEAVYQYIGMMRRQCREGWPDWINEELRRVHELSYRFGNELSPDETVEHLVESMAPHAQLPPERLLDGSALLFEFDASAVQSLLDDHLAPVNARIEIMSSEFGFSSDFESRLSENLCTETIIPNLKIDKDSEIGAFDVKLAGEPQIDPMFGTHFWCHEVPQSWMDKLIKCAEPCLPLIKMLDLPPRNPFVPQNFGLKPFPDDDSDHPLLNASLKLCIPVGKTKHWFAATVLRYNKKKNSVLLSFEDEDEKWHVLDHALDELAKEGVMQHDSFEGTMDMKKVRYRVVALSLVPGVKGAGMRMFGDESDLDVQEGIAFPPIPPASARKPIEISTSNLLKMWWLQDRVFKRPIAELRVQLICAKANSSALYRTAADAFQCLCADALLETTYLAKMCELGCGIEATDIGFSIRVHGFQDKLLDLFRTTLELLLSFRGCATGLPESIDEQRFHACTESLERRYKNTGITSADLSSGIRVRAIRTNLYSAHEMLQALTCLSVDMFSETISSLLEDIAVESFYHGNADRKEADRARDLILQLLDSIGATGIPRKKYPPQSVLRIPSVFEANRITVPSKNIEEPNTSCEIYIQVGKDDLRDRTSMDVLIHMMEEPLYDQVRTKDQFGYDVHCDVRKSWGIIGCIFHVTTNVKSADDVVQRIDMFLTDFRKELIKMSHDVYQEHIIGLAKQKLEMFNSLSEETGCLWSEIRDGRFEWEAWRNETICLKSLTKDDVLRTFDSWLRPGQLRKIMAVQVIGTGDTDASKGRPEINGEIHGIYVDRQVSEFHAKCKKQTWGKVTAKLF